MERKQRQVVKSLSEAWKMLSQRVFEEMEGWRNEHPRATFREIEEELDGRLSAMRARMLEDLAQKSVTRKWSGQKAGTGPRCPQCGTVLQASGTRVRTLLTQGDQEVKLTCQYGTCPQGGSGLFRPPSVPRRPVFAPARLVIRHLFCVSWIPGTLHSNL